MEAKQYDVIIVGGGMGGLNPATLTYALDKEELWDDSGQCWVQ